MHACQAKIDFRYFSKPRHIVLVIAIFHLRLPFISFVFVITIRFFINLTAFLHFCHTLPKRLVICFRRIFIIVGTIHLHGSQQLLQFRNSLFSKHLHFSFPRHFRLHAMLSDVHFHPSHIVPASKLKSAFVKFPHHTKSQMLMKMYAVSCQIFIPGLRHSDTRFHILDAHSPQFFLQCCIQSAASRICILGSDIVSPRSFFNKYSTKGGKWAIVRARLVLVWTQLPALLTPVNNSITDAAWARGTSLHHWNNLLFLFPGCLPPS